ncbi:MAG: hypothetical protein JWM10_2290 [Myxococcaceae bacterium]|nr:hypothetical protein [Myxococcaceae bacterium]
MNRALAALCAALVGCADAPPAPPSAGLPQRSLVAATAPTRVLAIGSNYLSGTAWSVAADGSSRPLPLGATGDTVVRPLGEVIAVLHRDPAQADNLTLLEERDGRVALVSQVDLRAAAEPRGEVNAHDVVALDARTLLVARYQRDALAVVDVARAEVTRTVDLAPYRGAAPRPHADALYRHGDRVYVTLQRLDDTYSPTQRGLVVQLDARTLAVTATLELPFADPIGAMVPVRDGVVRIAMIGWYSRVGDGGVVELDLRGDAPVATVVLRDDDLPAAVRGNIDGLAVVDDDVMVLKVVGERREGRDIDVTRIVRYDRRSGAARVLMQRGVWSGAVPVVLGDTVYVGDPGEGAGHAGAGIRRYDLAGEARGGTAAAVGVEMFPYDLRAAP